MAMTAMFAAMALTAFPPLVQVELGQQKPTKIQIIRGKPSKQRATEPVPTVVEVAPAQAAPAPAPEAPSQREAREQQERADAEKREEAAAQTAQKKAAQEAAIRKQGAAVRSGFQDAANALTGD